MTFTHISLCYATDISRPNKIIRKVDVASMRWYDHIYERYLSEPSYVYHKVWKTIIDYVWNLKWRV